MKGHMAAAFAVKDKEFSARMEAYIAKLPPLQQNAIREAYAAWKEAEASDIPKVMSDLFGGMPGPDDFMRIVALQVLVEHRQAFTPHASPYAEAANQGHVHVVREAALD